MASNDVLAFCQSRKSGTDTCRDRSPAADSAEVGQRDDAVGIRVGQRIEQDGVDDAEHGGVRADPERHHENANQRRATIPAQGPYGVAGILQRGFEQGNAAAIAIGLFHGFDATQLDERASARLVERHAGAQIVVDVKLDVTLELVFEVTIVGRPAEQSPEPPQYRSDLPHGALPGKNGVIDSALPPRVNVTHIRWPYESGTAPMWKQ